MTVNLTPQQIAWLEQIKAERGFASIDEAAQAIVADAMLHAEPLDLDDLSWAKPLVDEALADLEAGVQTIPLADMLASLERRATALDNK